MLMIGDDDSRVETTDIAARGERFEGSRQGLVKHESHSSS
jgi:hypothetical protein